MTAPLRPVLSGTAVVCCIHDRQKRQVVTEAQLVALGIASGQYDPRQDRINRCACCQNLFFNRTDIPRFCSHCMRPNVHPPGGPPPEPTGAVDE